MADAAMTDANPAVETAGADAAAAADAAATAAADAAENVPPPADGATAAVAAAAVVEAGKKKAAKKRPVLHPMHSSPLIEQELNAKRRYKTIHKSHSYKAWPLNGVTQSISMGIIKPHLDQVDVSVHFRVCKRLRRVCEPLYTWCTMVVVHVCKKDIE